MSILCTCEGLERGKCSEMNRGVPCEPPRRLETNRGSGKKGGGRQEEEGRDGEEDREGGERERSRRREPEPCAHPQAGVLPVPTGKSTPRRGSGEPRKRRLRRAGLKAELKFCETDEAPVKSLLFLCRVAVLSLFSERACLLPAA